MLVRALLCIALAVAAGASSLCFTSQIDQLPPRPLTPVRSPLPPRTHLSALSIQDAWPHAAALWLHRYESAVRCFLSEEVDNDPKQNGATHALVVTSADDESMIRSVSAQLAPMDAPAHARYVEVEQTGTADGRLAAVVSLPVGACVAIAVHPTLSQPLHLLGGQGARTAWAEAGLSGGRKHEITFCAASCTRPDRTMMDTTAHAHVGHEHGEKQGKGKPFGPDAWLALTTVSLLNTENRRGGLTLRGFSLNGTEKGDVVLSFDASSTMRATVSAPAAFVAIYGVIRSNFHNYTLYMAYHNADFNANSYTIDVKGPALNYAGGWLERSDGVRVHLEAAGPLRIAREGSEWVARGQLLHGDSQVSGSEWHFVFGRETDDYDLGGPALALRQEHAVSTGSLPVALQPGPNTIVAIDPHARTLSVEGVVQNGRLSYTLPLIRMAGEPVIVAKGETEGWWEYEGKKEDIRGQGTVQITKDEGGYSIEGKHVDTPWRLRVGQLRDCTWDGAALARTKTYRLSDAMGHAAATISWGGEAVAASAAHGEMLWSNWPKERSGGIEGRMTTSRGPVHIRLRFGPMQVDPRTLKMSCIAPHCRLDGWIKGDSDRLPISGALEIVSGNVQGRLIRSDTGNLALTWHAVLSECVDEVDECALETHDCPANTECVNAWGSYDCIPTRRTKMLDTMQSVSKDEHRPLDQRQQPQQAQQTQPSQEQVPPEGRPISGPHQPAEPPRCQVEVQACRKPSSLMWRVLTDKPVTMTSTPHYQLLEEKRGLVRALAKPPMKLYPNHLLSTYLPDKDARVRWILPPPCATEWLRVGDLPACPEEKVPHSIAFAVFVALLIAGGLLLLYTRFRRKRGGFIWEHKKDDDFIWPEEDTRIRYRLVDGHQVV